MMKNKRILVFIFFNTIFILLFLLHFYEVFITLNEDSYFSDSRSYYNASQYFPPSYNDGYSFVLALAFLKKLIGYKGAILLFFLIYLIMTYKLVKVFKINTANFILLYHPFIAFVFVRGLKEILLIFFFGLSFILLKRLSLYRFSITSALNYMPLKFLKPFGEFILPASFVLYGGLKKLNIKLVIALSTLFLLSATLIRSIVIEKIPLIKNQIDVLIYSGYPVDYTNNPVLPILRFIFGPGPLKAGRSFFVEIYEFQTLMTSVSLFLGSLYTLTYFTYLFAYRKKFQNINWNKFIIILATIHCGIYLLIQDGAVDTRQRAFLFFLLSFIIHYPKIKNRKNDQISII